MAEQKQKSEKEQQPKDALEPESNELTDKELEKASGGTIGSQTSGAGAGKIPFDPW